jgi:hypothetical protein
MNHRQAVQVALTTALAISTATACGGGQQSNLGTNQFGQPMASRPGGILRNKAVLLTGAAALYYLYHRQEALRKAGHNVPRYFLSQNGHVYWRDQAGTPHWISAPTAGLSVPESVADQYKDFQGFDGSTTGRGLSGLAGRGMY